jgi:hypothetical protein
MAEATGIENRWLLFDTVPNIVQEKFEDGRASALAAFTTAQAIIEDLRQMGKTLNTIDTSTSINRITPPDSGSFTGTIPPTPTGTDLNMPEAPSDTDALQYVIKSKLINDISNVVAAIPDSVETAIFSKDSERAAIVLQDTLDNISAEWSKRGFTLPNAMLSAGLEQAIIEHGNKREDISRDIAIENFKLTDTNVKFAVQQGIAYNLYKVEVFKSQVSAEIARVRSIVDTFLGEVEAYKTSAQAFSTLADVKVKEFVATVDQEKIVAELLIKNVEIAIKNFEVEYGLKIEADKAIGSINAQIVAGAFSSISASVHMDASDSASYGFSSNPSY